MTAAQLQSAIASLFPTAKSGIDYTFTLDSAGNATITLWNNALGVQPTMTELTAAVTAAQLASAQQAQIAIITAASVTAQTTGFTSSALGSAYTYPSSPTDQGNLTAVVTSSLYPNAPTTASYSFWCTSAAGVSGFVAHTAGEIQQVGSDALKTIMAIKQQAVTLADTITACTTVAAVQAIVWP